MSQRPVSRSSPVWNIYHSKKLEWLGRDGRAPLEEQHGLDPAWDESDDKFLAYLKDPGRSRGAPYYYGEGDELLAWLREGEWLG